MTIQLYRMNNDREFIMSNNRECILLTGGCGYIGSHICYEILEENQYDVVIIDNLCHSTQDGIERLKTKFGVQVPVHVVDLRAKNELLEVFKKYPIKAVIHLAGLKSVKESVSRPLDYYDNNVKGSRVLLECMKETGVEFLIFSSSACVYGEPTYIPVTEETPVRAINPYGQTKVDVEELLESQDWGCFVSLRYFNPIGAHPSGLIGEDPKGTPENLVPYLLKVGSGDLAILDVYGDDYQTRDGTCVRDYLHVVDLAQAHLKAMKYLFTHHVKYNVFNLGTGTGYTVLEVIEEFFKQGVPICYKIASRRAGDAPMIYADTRKAKEILGWKAKLGMAEMARDSWHWWKKATRREDEISSSSTGDPEKLL